MTMNQYPRPFECNHTFDTSPFLKCMTKLFRDTMPPVAATLLSPDLELFRNASAPSSAFHFRLRSSSRKSDDEDDLAALQKCNNVRNEGTTVTA